MKKILLLGGSIQQLPAILYAKKQGYYTILCDYLADNPGQNYADKFYCVSTTDKEAVLKVAQREEIDGIVAYASDPAAPTAAYVAERMGLPTNPYKSVEILSFKDKFRHFLKTNNFNCPNAESFSDCGKAIKAMHRFRFPVMVKPVDSSGSKGVQKIEALNESELAFRKAQAISRCGQVLAEEYITMDHEYMVGGDCFVINGEVAFWGLLNSHRDKNGNPFVPIGTSYPIFINKKRLEAVKEAVQLLVNALEIKFGAFNIEIMFNKNDELFFIEMGPRNGGNMIPNLLHIATGADMIAATIELALGNKFVFNLTKNSDDIFLSTYILHTDKNGILKEIKLEPEVKKHIIKEVFYVNRGEPVACFDGANKAIGIIFLKFNTIEKMLSMMDNMNEWVHVIVE